MAYYQIGDIAPIEQGVVDTKNEYWLLNLDMVESDTGRVLGYNYVPKEAIGNSTVSFDTGNVLYSKLRPYLNKVVLPLQAGYATSEMIPLRPNKAIITREYLTYYLRSPYFVNYINSKTSGAKMPRAKIDELKKFKIYCPSLDEQKEIVARMDELVISTEICQKGIEKLSLLIKARFQELFNGVMEEDTIQNLCRIIDYRGKTPTKVESGLPFITAKNVRPHHLSLEPQEYITKETYDKVMIRGFPREGDVLFTTEAPLGNVCRIPHFDTEFYVGQRIITLQTERLLPVYLEYALDSAEFKRKLSEKASGSTVTGIKVRLLEKLSIPVPTMNQQVEFQKYVQQIEESRTTLQCILDKLLSLQTSLMQQYFC